MEAGAAKPIGWDRYSPRSASIAWLALGCLLLVGELVGVSFVGGALAAYRVPHPYFLDILVGLLNLGLLFLIAKCFIHAKRLRAPSAAEALRRDHRPPVVYFRPFAADDDASKPISFASWTTDEEQLAKALTKIGPMVAIGSPNARLPFVGAARMSVEHPNWREVALDLMEGASVIVLRIGNGAGFWWEFESVTRRAEPRKLVLLIPRNEALYEEFRLASRKLLPTELPVLAGWNVKKWFWGGNLKAVVLFDAQWRPWVIDLQSYRVPWLRRTSTPLVPALTMTLRPLYENAGVHWRPPRINWISVAGLGFLAVIALVILVLLLLFAF